MENVRVKAGERNRMGETGRFFVEFLKAPGAVGAFCASSPFLARRIVGMVDVGAARVVVELGPGAGSFTGEILRRMGPGVEYVAFEVSGAFAETLRGRFPGARVIVDGAQRMGRHLGPLGLLPVDVVVSGLPWAVFPEGLQREILGAVRESLRPGGEFVTFAYAGPHCLAAGRRFRRLLGETFGEVERSRVVWWNVFPAFVYKCRKI